MRRDAPSSSPITGGDLAVALWGLVPDGAPMLPDMTVLAAPLPPVAASPTAAPTAAPAPTLKLCDDLDQARRKGPLQTIRVPPCPEALAKLQVLLAAPEPDLTAVGTIADGDVAMSATLIRRANSPLFTAGAPVTTVGQAMNRLGLDETVRLMTSVAVQRAVPATSRHLSRFWELSARRVAHGDARRQRDRGHAGRFSSWPRPGSCSCRPGG